jgi:arsenite oxidase small subunit
MSRCDKLVDIGRRRFLRDGGLLAVASGAVGALATGTSQAAPALARVEYPSARLANLIDLRPDVPLPVAYPDQDAPGVLLKLGNRVSGGAGPDGDIVGFSTICPHKGFPLTYNNTDRTLNCAAHYSRFDCEAGGQQIWGHATQNLAQYVLRIADNGDIHAEGLDELLYGRLSNVL